MLLLSIKKNERSYFARLQKTLLLRQPADSGGRPGYGGHPPPNLRIDPRKTTK
jgi:hypothetical protein